MSAPRVLSAARSDGVALTETLDQRASDGEPEAADGEASAFRSMGLREWGSNTKKARVLVGSAILQLPIWGFAMNYGVFQEFYSSNWSFSGDQELTGIIGTTSNGVMYLSMPFLFAIFTRRWARMRRAAALGGVALTCLSFLLSSFSTSAWHLVATQGVMSALGCALVYSPTTLSLGEWFSNSHRAVAYGVVLSCKNIVGSACPFLLRALLDRYGFRVTIRIWMAITAGSGVLAVLLIPTPPSSLESNSRRARRIPWQFLRHRTFYIYSTAIILQSSGYGIPQTYLNTYAHDVASLSQTSATLLLTLFNIPGIVASAFFGYLTENKYLTISAGAVATISSISSALAAFLFWGLTSQGSMALLVLFSTTFGFFAGGYSATWGGIVAEMERESAQRNEPLDAGMIYGLFNGARGIGYVGGGLAGVPLLNVGGIKSIGHLGYGTAYGPLIIFTGLSSALGGWGLLWKCNWRKLMHI